MFLAVYGPDIARCFLVIVPGFVTLGMAFVVLRLYWAYYRSYIWKPKSKLWRKGYHVWLISAAHILFVIEAILDSFGHFGSGLTWRVPIHSFAMFISIAALYLFVRTERGRVHEST